MPLLVVLLPHQIVNIAGEEGKGTTLGMTLLFGSISSLVFSPLFGALSDISHHPMVCLLSDIVHTARSFHLFNTLSGTPEAFHDCRRRPVIH